MSSALHRSLRRHLPFVIEIHEQPERLLNGTNGRYGENLHPDLVQWIDDNIHDEWQWNAAFVNYRAGSTQSEHDPRVYLIFYFKRAADAALFRLAHSV